MRMLKGLVAGALALCGLMAAEAPASARPMSAPELIQVSTVQPAAAAEQAVPCYWRHYGYYRPVYGYHRPFYGYHRPYYGYHRFYGYHRPFGYHRRFVRHFYY